MNPAKSTAPWAGPPPWLEPSKELPLQASPYSRDAFVRECMAALVALGCTEEQAAGVTANAVNETGWGRSVFNGNAGGWKITEAFAKAYRARTGEAPAWWKARGNVASGDPAWCYYRAFASLGEFLEEWVDHFVPRPGGTAAYPGYRHCGELFWAGGDWFPELIRVGYKGPVTKARPQRSIDEHRSIVRSVRKIWAGRPPG